MLGEHDLKVRVDNRKGLVVLKTHLATVTLTLAGFLEVAQMVQEASAGAPAR